MSELFAEEFKPKETSTSAKYGDKINDSIASSCSEMEELYTATEESPPENEATEFKTFPSLEIVATATPLKDIDNRNLGELLSKLRSVIDLKPNEFAYWLATKGMLKYEQRCTYHPATQLILHASDERCIEGCVWTSKCCPQLKVSVFRGSIFEMLHHTPSSIIKLIYYWSLYCDVKRVSALLKVDGSFLKCFYMWMRAVCTLTVQQKCPMLGGPQKYVEVGLISLGSTAENGSKRKAHAEVLGLLDSTDNSVRLCAFQPSSCDDLKPHNRRDRFRTLLAPLLRWVQKDSYISIDTTIDKSVIYDMGFENIVQAQTYDGTTEHNNFEIMRYLQQIRPQMFRNMLHMLSLELVQQFLDERVWRKEFGHNATAAFENIIQQLAELTQLNGNEKLTQTLDEVAEHPFKDWRELSADGVEDLHKSRETFLNALDRINSK